MLSARVFVLATPVPHCAGVRSWGVSVAGAWVYRLFVHCACASRRSLFVLPVFSLCCLWGMPSCYLNRVQQRVQSSLDLAGCPR